MGSLVDRTRLGALAIAAAILLASSAVLASLRPGLILGQVNQAGQANTALRAANQGEAFSVIHEGPLGIAIRGAATQGGGTGGSFLGVRGTGVDARTRGSERFGLYATNEATGTGTGAAIRADGRANTAIKAESVGSSAVDASSGGAGPAVRATTPGGGELATCDQGTCAALEASGRIGFAGTTATASGSAVLAVDASAAGTGYSVVAEGAALVDGELSITGGCLGCGTSFIGRNESETPIARGDAVTLLGVDVGPDGSTIVRVRLAVEGERVIGVADRLITFDATPAGDPELAGGWHVGGEAIPPGSMARVVTEGMMTIDRVYETAAAGDPLVVGPRPGSLEPAGDQARADDRIAATFLGRRPDGLSAILVGID